MHLRHCVLFFQHVQGCRDGHFVFASRLGSLSTVFTWLRSRACAGMQGLGVLALVVVAPCGFAAHVAPDEAVLSSPRNRCGRRKLPKFCSVLGARAPTTNPPKTKAPGPPLPSPCTPPTPQGILQKNAPSLGPVPLPPTPPAPKPLDPPPSPSLGFRGGPGGLLFSVWSQPSPFFGTAIQSLRPPQTLSCNQGPWFTALSTRPAPVGTPPTPQGILQKTSFFFFLYALEMSKIQRKLRNLLRPWGPCPYHLPPGTKAPGPYLPSPCTPPHPTGYPSKKYHFSSSCTCQTSKIRRKLRNLLRPWGPCPYHLPPRHRSPWTPPKPQPRT